MSGIEELLNDNTNEVEDEDQDEEEDDVSAYINTPNDSDNEEGVGVETVNSNDSYSDYDDDDSESAPPIEKNKTRVINEGVDRILNTMTESKVAGESANAASDPRNRITHHVVNLFRDHIKSSPNASKPKVSITFTNKLSNLGYDETYKAKHQSPDENRWYSDVDVNYKIKGKVYSGDMIALDDAYLDLTMKLDKDGNDADNCLLTWVNIYMKENTLRTFANMVLDGTGYSLDVRDYTLDKGQGLLSTIANISEDDPVMFNVLSKAKDGSGGVLMNTIDTIQGVCEKENFRKIYVGTLMLGMSGCVYVPKGAEPEKGVHKVVLKLELVGVRLYGVADKIKVIKLGKRARRKYN